MADEFKWDQRQFDRTLAEYLQVSKKTLAEIVNTKAYYIARKALWFTPKANAGKIRTDLGEAKAVRLVKLKSGRWSHNQRNTITFFGSGGSAKGVPLLALIIQKRRRLAGHPSPWKGVTRAAGAAAMLQAMREAFISRLHSIAFLKAGWLPSIRTMAPVADKTGGLPAIDTRQVGRPKGEAVIAQPGLNPIAKIINHASTRRDRRAALVRYGAPALQQAFDDEALSMKVYIQNHMRQDAEAFNRAQK
jgi:hypothetical protein